MPSGDYSSKLGIPAANTGNVSVLILIIAMRYNTNDIQRCLTDTEYRQARHYYNRGTRYRTLEVSLYTGNTRLIKKVVNRCTLTSALRKLRIEYENDMPIGESLRLVATEIEPENTQVVFDTAWVAPDNQ